MTTGNRGMFVQMFTPVRRALIALTAQLRSDPHIGTVEEIEKLLLSKPEDAFAYFRDLQLRLFEEDIQFFQEWGNNKFGKSATMDGAVARFIAVRDAEQAWTRFREMFLVARYNVQLYQDTKDSLPTRL